MILQKMTVPELGSVMLAMICAAAVHRNVTVMVPTFVNIEKYVDPIR